MSGALAYKGSLAQVEFSAEGEVFVALWLAPNPGVIANCTLLSAQQPLPFPALDLPR